MLILMTFILALGHGCNSNTYSTADTPTSKHIIEIVVIEEDKSWNCVVKGSHPLTFSAINHLSPTGILLYFPNTSLDMADLDFSPPANDIIGGIEADEFMDGNLINSGIGPTAYPRIKMG
jgi:hypothetical protein